MIDFEQYYRALRESLEREERYAIRDENLYNEGKDKDETWNALSALESERRAINTSQRRNKWREVKFNSRQKKKAFDVDNKSMDSGLQEYPLSSADKFLARGNHRKTALER